MRRGRESQSEHLDSFLKKINTSLLYLIDVRLGIKGKEIVVHFELSV